ncbi:MAG: type transport system permease protein [Patescibacteria group bacterium]|nr:type transport system permease protein [Patescibacteria group bacterium]
MYNLGTVLWFEIMRTLKRKSFWITAVAFPIGIGLIFAIIYFSNISTKNAAENTINQKFSFMITDDSGLINKELIKQHKATESDNKQAAIKDVSDGKIDAYFYYPDDLVNNKVEIYAAEAGIFDNGRYEGVAKTILQQSVESVTDTQTTAVLKDSIGFNSILYKNGLQFDGYKEIIAPGIFLVLFYILIVTFGNQMLSSTTEEKENRVIEIILTTIKARTLIMGKIISLIILAFFQVAIILIPTIIAYVLFHNALSLPNFDLSNIPLDPTRIAIAAIIFILSFLMITGLLVAIGSAVPTAKEANGFFGVVMIMMFGPLYAVSLFVSAPTSNIVKFLTLFPLTAPIPMLLRNAIGNLTTFETITGITILAISAIVILTIAIRLFQYGALEYTNRISLKKVFQKH